MILAALAIDGADTVLGFLADGEPHLGTFEGLEFVESHIHNFDPEVILVVENGHPAGEASLLALGRDVFRKPTHLVTVEGDEALGERVLRALAAYHQGSGSSST